MLKTIKYDLDFEKYFEITMPKGAEILKMEMFDQIPQLHVLIEPVKETEKRRFIITVAGEFIEEDKKSLWYLGTFQFAPRKSIYHVFELITQVQ